MFFFNDTATTEIYTLSLHDALPISAAVGRARGGLPQDRRAAHPGLAEEGRSRGPGGRRRLPEGGDVGPAFRSDRKSTRLNSSHANISYAVFCLKKKKNNPNIPT